MGEVKLKNFVIVSVKNLSFDGILHKQLRINQYDLSLKNYGKLIGKSGRQISRYEACHHGIHNEDGQVPTLEPFKKMVLALQIEPMELLGLQKISADLIITNKINIDQFDVNSNLIFDNKFCKCCGSLLKKGKE